jgi:hypothetical protein
MSSAGVTSTFSTVSPLISIPRMFSACSRASAAVLASFTPSGLSPASGVDLGLHDDHAAVLSGDGLGVVGRRGDLTRRDRNPGRPEELFRLILVDVHARLDRWIEEVRLRGPNRPTRRGKRR